jgi:D-lyxose ketol-isomerase
MDMNRRSALTGLAVVAAGAAMKGSAMADTGKKNAVPRYPNEHFYKADGTFDAEAAKAAFYEMFDAFGYPIVDRLRSEEFWVVDFGMGKFTEVGMGGIFWVNNKADNYFGHEIYLLPGQMIPEHKHVRTDAAGPKMEAWQPRHGWIYIYGEGDPTPGVEKHIPPSHRECAVARVEKKLLPGEVGMLGGAEQWHWMYAPDGAIVTEYATYHDGAGLRFTHPDVKF